MFYCSLPLGHIVDLMALNISESTQDEIRMQLKIVIILIRDGKIYIQE